jgi:hypothetical protein
MIAGDEFAQCISVLREHSTKQARWYAVMHPSHHRTVRRYLRARDRRRKVLRSWFISSNRE